MSSDQGIARWVVQYLLRTPHTKSIYIPTCRQCSRQPSQHDPSEVEGTYVHPVARMGGLTAQGRTANLLAVPHLIGQTKCRRARSVGRRAFTDRDLEAVSAPGGVR